MALTSHPDAASLYAKMREDRAENLAKLADDKPIISDDLIWRAIREVKALDVALDGGLHAATLAHEYERPSAHLFTGCADVAEQLAKKAQYLAALVRLRERETAGEAA